MSPNIKRLLGKEHANYHDLISAYFYGCVEISQCSLCIINICVIA